MLLSLILCWEKLLFEVQLPKSTAIWDVLRVMVSVSPGSRLSLPSSLALGRVSVFAQHRSKHLETLHLGKQPPVEKDQAEIIFVVERKGL